MELKEFKIEDNLENMEMVHGYLKLAFADNEITGITTAIGDALRSVGLRKIAEQTGIQETGLHKSFSGESVPRLDTVLKALNAMGFELTIKKNKDFSHVKTKAETRKTPRRKPATETRPQATA